MYDTNRFIRAAEPCAYHEAFAEYVNTKYKPGILNPFMDTSLYIKH